jgi:hypothetical protein
LELIVATRAADTFRLIDPGTIINDLYVARPVTETEVALAAGVKVVTKVRPPALVNAVDAQVVPSDVNTLPVSPGDTN